MKTLAIDVSKQTGWAFMDGDYVEVGTFQFVSLDAYYKIISELVLKWKPECIISARPTRHVRVVAFQSKLLAIVELIAERNEIYFYEAIDSECKKAVLGKGKAPKEEIIKWASDSFGLKDLTQDPADAVMFAEFVKLKVVHV